MEAGNVKAMRDALSDACYAMFDFLKTQGGGYDEMANALDKAKAALAAPPRNCDVGTPAEQEVRFKSFCESHWDLNKPDSECAGCPLDEKRVGTECEFAWLQMPYEEGVK